MFNEFCHLLNRLRLSWLAAFVRLVLLAVLARWVQRGNYAGGVPGYRGWLAVPRLGVLAFIRSDGSRQVRW